MDNGDKGYPFRVCDGHADAGELVWLNFSEMMAADTAGFLVLEDGREARRARSEECYGEQSRTRSEKLRVKMVSESLGFGREQLADFENDRVSSGVRGVEFIPDPRDGKLMNVQFDGPQSRKAYLKHRGFHDKSRSAGGSSISAKDLADAKALLGMKVKRQS